MDVSVILLYSAAVLTRWNGTGARALRFYDMASALSAGCCAYGRKGIKNCAGPIKLGRRVLRDCVRGLGTVFFFIMGYLSGLCSTLSYCRFSMCL